MLIKQWFPWLPYNFITKCKIYRVSHKKVSLFEETFIEEYCKEERLT